eukprot:8975138-Lingulodinium_polyedra.AAC.1
MPRSLNDDVGREARGRQTRRPRGARKRRGNDHAHGEFSHRAGPPGPGPENGVSSTSNIAQGGRGLALIC